MEQERKNASQSYYNEDNIQRENVPFAVNCIGEIALSKGFRTYQPNGRNDYYLMYMSEGELPIRAGELNTTLRAGSVICMRPHTPYSYGKGENDPTIRYYWMHFTGGDCERVLAECGIPLGEVAELGSSHEAAYFFEDMFSEFRRRRQNFDFAITLKAQYLLLYIGRNISREGRRLNAPVERSIKYIHTHIKHRITVKQLADMEFLSPSRYREVFREVMGQSPTEYILGQRIHLACELIEQGDISLDRVAELCGFSDRLYFQRVFKKKMSLTPGRYRAMLLI